MSANKEYFAPGQAAGLITFTPIEARTRFPGCHIDCLCGARLTAVVYIVANGVRHHKLHCLACKRLSLPQRLLDCVTMAEHCGGAGVETHHWAPRSLFRDYNAWPTAQLRRACHALWHDVMRAGARSP